MPLAHGRRSNRSLGGEAPLSLLDTEVGYELVPDTLGRIAKHAAKYAASRCQPHYATSLRPALPSPPAPASSHRRTGP